MASAPPPLRTALIGLSSTAITSWASGAHLPGLLSATGRSKLPITALLNSSVKAAQSAIEKYKLGPETKAYGSPEDLANDPDIDLVICNTRVDKHFETILPSVKKGKHIFVEWPIAANLEDVETLVREAKKSGSRVAVGLQRRWGPPAVKLSEIIKDGVNGKKLGKILSSSVLAYGGTNHRDIVPEGLAYFADRKVGGNVIVIGFAHCEFLPSEMFQAGCAKHSQCSTRCSLCWAIWSPAHTIRSSSSSAQMFACATPPPTKSSEPSAQMSRT